MFYNITTTPYLPCNITRKELYDFYYTLVTLTTGYGLYYIDTLEMWLRMCIMYSTGSTHYYTIKENSGGKKEEEGSMEYGSTI